VLEIPQNPNVRRPTACGPAISEGRALALLRTQAIAEATPPAEEDAARNAQPSVALETAPAPTGAPADHRRARRASNEYVRLESDPIG
jgi:hypothetical protein